MGKIQRGEKEEEGEEEISHVDGCEVWATGTEGFENLEGMRISTGVKRDESPKHEEDGKSIRQGTYEVLSS